MDKKFHNCNPEIWGGIECTINRIGDEYKDQLQFSRHYNRRGDLEKIADLGIKTLRYPVLWEFHEPVQGMQIDWSWSENQLNNLYKKNISPIVGLVHHGSGPAFTNLLNENFASGLANYASNVATKFPWVEYYTPVNEPLTTARFSGIYGFWYPHHTNDISFAKMLLNQVKAVVLSMQAIRKINPLAKLIQTEDLGKTYSTPYLQFQAIFENERRWLTFDLLCGRVNENHEMWKYFSRLGINSEALKFFLDNPCPPDIMGFNHYITSERYLDENINNYPKCTHGGNEIQVYADVEAVRVKHSHPCGLEALLKEAWERYQSPMAITEVQLNSTREEQLKWFFEVWNISKSLKENGIDIRAITAWSLLGAFGWNRLLTSMDMEYEPGVFDIRSGNLRETALSSLIKNINSKNKYIHPVLNEKGWWHRDSRFLWNHEESKSNQILSFPKSTPILIIGKTGTLGKAFARICKERLIEYKLLGRKDLDIRNVNQIETCLFKYKPWAVINTAGFVKVDEAEHNIDTCYDINTLGPHLLAAGCIRHGAQFLTFSSDLVFDGKKQSPYYENDKVNPLNIYGKSKACAEISVLRTNPEALVVRTSSFFSPWDGYNFIHQVIEKLSANQKFYVADDIFISPTYVPDLVNVSLDLLIDKEKGIWHLTNKGEVSWAQLALRVAEKTGLSINNLVVQNSSLMDWKAIRPKYSVLKSLNGNLLPNLKNALNRYIDDVKNIREVSEVYNTY